MEVYIFVRESGWYPVTLRDDDDAIANAECDPDTLKVERASDNKIVWPENTH